MKEAKQKRVRAVLPHLYKILGKANEAIVIESRAVAAWGWEGGMRIGMRDEGENDKGARGNFWG